MHIKPLQCLPKPSTQRALRQTLRMKGSCIHFKESCSVEEDEVSYDYFNDSVKILSREEKMVETVVETMVFKCLFVRIL